MSGSPPIGLCATFCPLRKSSLRRRTTLHVQLASGERWTYRLTHIKDQLKYSAVGLLFDAPDDLVVDTGSMFGPLAGDTAGTGLPALMNLSFDSKYITQFENSPTVHHTNYFRQPEAVKAMEALL